MSRTVSVPEWLNESFVQTVLQHGRFVNKEVKVNSVEVTPAAAAGANYTSVVFRVHGKYQTEEDHDKDKDVSMIVKTIVTTDFLGQFCVGCGFGETEYIAYTEFLPEMYKVFNKEPLTAKLLYSPDRKTLVLEDLKDYGFVLPDRLKQLDFDHCLVCLKTVAKFHAASVAVIRKNPEFIVKLGEEPLYNRQKEAMYKQMKDLTKNNSKIFTKAVKEWGGIEDFEEKSRHLWETLTDDICDIFEPRKDSLNVMNHGDVWSNNIMFKYNSDGNIVDFRLLDLQMCYYGTPVTDVLYFLFSSANRDVRENRLDELMSLYLEMLNSVLEQLDCEERLTREQLDAELKRCQCYILIVIFYVLAVALADPDDLFNISDVTEENMISAEGSPFGKMYYSKYYKETAAQILHYLDKEGFFERQ